MNRPIWPWYALGLLWFGGFLVGYGMRGIMG